MSDSHDIIYIADPMCSWCWGFAEEIHEIRNHITQKGLNFNILVGGLRVGGGQPWDDEFKKMIKHHWQQVTQRSGQEFNFDLFDLAEFDYDTEPACRAVVAARGIMSPEDVDSSKMLDFFVAIQQKFYVGNQNPNIVEFYQSICQSLQLDYAAFKNLFESAEIKAKTAAEFDLVRRWGVTGYPTILYSDGQQMYIISSGYQKSTSVIEIIDQLI